MTILGPVRFWREGDVLFAANDYISGAYVATNYRTKIGKHGWHPFRDTQIYVQFISPEIAEAWTDAKENPKSGA
jgi:hypothetical protein